MPETPPFQSLVSRAADLKLQFAQKNLNLHYLSLILLVPQILPKVKVPTPHHQRVYLHGPIAKPIDLHFD